MGGDAVGDPHIPGGSEIVSRNQQQFILLGPLTECVGIFFQSLYKQIEGSVRIDTFVSVFRQASIQQFPVLPVYAKIRNLPGTGSDHMLKQAGSAHISQGAPCPADCGVHILAILQFIRHQNVSDAFPGRDRDLL